MSKKKRNALGSSFVSHSRDMRESPAWAALPDNARRVLDRLEVEHMRHGGAENGALQCPYTDFERAGIRRASVALAVRQCVALGFLAIERQGLRSRAEFRAPSVYRLTYLNGCGRSPLPTDNWRSVTKEDAAAALEKALKTSPDDRTKKRTPRVDIDSRRENAPRPVDAKTRLGRAVL